MSPPERRKRGQRSASSSETSGAEYQRMPQTRRGKPDSSGGVLAGMTSQRSVPALRKGAAEETQRKRRKKAQKDPLDEIKEDRPCSSNRNGHERTPKQQSTSTNSGVSLRNAIDIADDTDSTRIPRKAAKRLNSTLLPVMQIKTEQPSRGSFGSKATTKSITLRETSKYFDKVTDQQHKEESNVCIEIVDEESTISSEKTPSQPVINVDAKKSSHEVALEVASEPCPLNNDLGDASAEKSNSLFLTKVRKTISSIVPFSQRKVPRTQSGRSKKKKGIIIEAGASLHMNKEPSKQQQLKLTDTMHEKSLRETRITRKRPRDYSETSFDRDELTYDLTLEIANLAVGSSVHRSPKLVVRPKSIFQVCYSRDKEILINFEKDDVKELRFYVKSESDTESFSFISMRVKKNKQTGLFDVSDTDYDPDSRHSELKYIVLEFQNISDCRQLLTYIKDNKCTPMQPYFEATAALTSSEKDDYCTKLSRVRSRRSRRQSRAVLVSKKPDYVEGLIDSDVVVGYPFPLTKEHYTISIKGLRELSGAPLEGEEVGHAPDVADQHEAKEEGRTSRAHYIDVLVKDIEKLDEGEWLNDTLIDFFMQWMVRNETSNLCHVFTTHFYTRLEKQGPEAVTRWTSKKKINIFELKVIFVPINLNLHWSCCIIVNPGEILNHIEKLETKADFENSDDRRPCILFFDSLRMHAPRTIQKHVLLWLNSEWKRLERPIPGKRENVFTKNTMELFRPEVTRQRNFSDCGVFCCRYTYAVYVLRNRSFSYKELNEAEKFPIIRDGKAFKFTRRDITRIRREMKELIKRLFHFYHEWKKEQKEEAKARGETVEDDEMPSQDSSNIEVMEVRTNIEIGSSSEDNDSAKSLVKSKKRRKKETPAETLSSLFKIEGISTTEDPTETSRSNSPTVNLDVKQLVVLKRESKVPETNPAADVPDNPRALNLMLGSTPGQHSSMSTPDQQDEENHCELLHEEFNAQCNVSDGHDRNTLHVDDGSTGEGETVDV